MLQAKYIKQLQDKEAAKEKLVENSGKEPMKRQYRSWRRGHFRKQPIGLRANKAFELRWIMGHWMGSVDLPIKVQATKIRTVDIPNEQKMKQLKLQEMINKFDKSISLPTFQSI